MGDWDSEIALAEVELTKGPDVIRSTFTFVAEPEGSGHIGFIKIIALVDEEKINTFLVPSIEVRSIRKPGVTLPSFVEK